MIDIDNLSREEKIELARTSKDINILTILSKDKNEFIREEVAYNSNTPTEALNLLALDVDTYVRYTVICNENVSIKILKELINDKDEDVREHAIKRLAELKRLSSFV